jgi:hypothetical protein
MTTAVFGNASFTKVEDLAGRLSNITASDGAINNLTANSITADSVSVNLPGTGLAARSTYTVTAYAPTGFSTLAASGVLFLNYGSGLAAATAATDTRLVLLPYGARVISAFMTNNGTIQAGATTFDLGTEVWSAAPTGTQDIGAAINAAGFQGTSVGVSIGATSTALGGTGDPLTGTVAAMTNTGITIQGLGAANTAGDFAVQITYIV